MDKITGNLITDLHPNGTVRMVFIAHSGGGNEMPLKANDLDSAEVLFMTCGLTQVRAASLIAELQRNKTASVETNIDEGIAIKFQYRQDGLEK